MFELPELPYAYDALQPAVSEATMRTHHDKHHKAYVDTTNTLIAEKDLSELSLEDLIKHAKSAGEQKLFNQSGQVWNHGFYWECMAPGAPKPESELTEAINRTFGGMEQLKAAFVAEGAGHFASGWVWLVADGDAKLKVVSTHDADTALVHDGLQPLIVCDLWEHAYYLDYKNVRKQFLETWFDGAANWAFAAKQFDAVRGHGQLYRYPAAA